MKMLSIIDIKSIIKRAMQILIVCILLSMNFTILNTAYAETIPVTGISLDPVSLSLQIGDTATLTATISPADASNQQINWTSSNPNIAVVDQGVITAFSTGTATITASTVDGSYTASCAVTVTAITPVPRNSRVRVKLTMNNPTTVPIYIDGNYSIAENATVQLQRQFYQVKLESGILNIYYGSQIIASGPTITIQQHTSTPDRNQFLWITNYKYGTRRYLGDMQFSISGSAIQLVNSVYLEEYLWGVVPHEMSNSWPTEALRSQAIAARTYAASAMGGTNYDFGDTSSDQVYKGYHPGNEEAIAAVNATERLVLQYDANNLVPTYYSASNGGYTDMPLHAWGSGANWPFPIRYDAYDVANPSSPYEEIYFPIVIDAEHPITTSDNVEGTPNIGNAVRYFKQIIFDSNQLQSNGFTKSDGSPITTLDDFELTGVLSLVPHTHDTSGTNEDHGRVPSSGVNDCVDYVRANGSFRVSATKDGSPANLDIHDLLVNLEYFDGANGIDTYKVYNMTSLRLTLIVPRYDGETLIGHSVFQRRYGHGVGMSQRGAQQRANAGHTYGQILSFYYPESGVIPLNIAKPSTTPLDNPVDPTNATIVCNDYLSVRESNTTSSNRIFTLPPNARVEVTVPYYSSDWHQINFGNQTAYVHKNYVTLDTNISVSSVSIDTTSATMYVDDTLLLTPTILPANATNQNVSWTSSDTAVVTVNSQGEVKAVGSGNAIITATTDDGNYTASCTIQVEAKPQITSTVYTIDNINQILHGISDDTRLETVISQLDNPAAQIRVVDKDTNPITDLTQWAATGMHIQLIHNDQVYDDLAICILGDVDGDGIIDIIDYSYVKLHIFEVMTLNGLQFMAADIDQDNIVDIIDYSYIKLDIFDVTSINEK